MHNQRKGGRKSKTGRIVGRGKDVACGLNLHHSPVSFLVRTC